MAHKRRTQKKHGGGAPRNLPNSEVRRLSFLAAREGRQLTYNENGNPIVGNVATSILESRRPSSVEEDAIGIPEEGPSDSMPVVRQLLSGRTRSTSPAARVRVVKVSPRVGGRRRRTHRRRRHTSRHR